MIRFTIYKDLEQANAIRFDYDCNYYYINNCYCPDDDDFICYNSCADASLDFNKLVMEQCTTYNREYTIFLCAEELDEEGEIINSITLDCIAAFMKDGKNIVLSGLDDKYPYQY